MKTSMTVDLLEKYVVMQLDNYFPDNEYIDKKIFHKCIIVALDRLEYCFKHIQKPYYFLNDTVVFNHLHSDHYAMFLYLLSNTVWETSKNEIVASKVFLLNKALHGIDVFYSVKLPEIFFFIHPVGTVLGNAVYNNFLAVYQGCTVGSTQDNKYPIFGSEIILYSNSSIIGNCEIGNNVVFAANSNIISSRVKSNSVVLGNYPSNKILVNKTDVIDRIFR